MKRFLFVLGWFLVLGGSDGYIFPICPNSEKGCMGYFSMVNFDFSYFTSSNKPKISLEIPDNPKSVSEVVLENLRGCFGPVIMFYTSTVAPFVAELPESEPFLKTYWDQFLEYVSNITQTDKVKGNNNSYLLFICTSLTIYLILYVYFSKKICQFYRNRLRRQYLEKVKQIFQKKD